MERTSPSSTAVRLGVRSASTVLSRTVVGLRTEGTTCHLTLYRRGALPRASLEDICSQVGARLNTAETYASESKPDASGSPGQLLTHYAPRLPAALCTVVADAAADDAKSDAYLANCVVVDFNGRLKALEKVQGLPRLVISGRRGGRGERALRHAALGRGRPGRGERVHRRPLGGARVVGAHRRRRGPRLPRGVGQRDRDPTCWLSSTGRKPTRQ